MPTTSRSHKAEAKFNVTTEFPHLGLHSAAATGNIGLAKYALSHGQPINSVIDGVLPLHAACSGGNEMVVRLLIDNGADVNAPRLPRRYSDKARSPSAPIIGATGSTPLHFAAANGHTQVVLTLLRHGARPDRADKRGVTPEVLARDNGWLACADAIRDWIVNKDRDLVERETLLGAIPLDEPEPTSHCRERHGSVCTCDGLECISTHVIRRLGVKHSIENAMLLFRSSGNDPQDTAAPIPDCTWPPPESLDSPPPNSDRRSSLPQSDDPPIPRRSRRRQHRPNSAGNGAESHHSHSRRLGSKYSLLHLFRKPSSELLSSHSTPGGGTISDVSMVPGTSNPTSSPTSPSPSSPSALALELNGSGQDPSPPLSSGVLRSSGASSGSPSTGGIPSVFVSSDLNASNSKSPRHAPFGLSPGRDDRLSEESEDEEEEEEEYEEYGVGAIRSRMMSADPSTQDMDFPFSIDVPVGDDSLGSIDARGRGDSLSTNLSATTASSTSLRTPAPLSAVLPPTIEDPKVNAHTHRPPPLIGLEASNVSSFAQAEALVAHARGQVLTAKEGDDIPLSARLAALGKSLRIERKLKEAGGSDNAALGLRIERRASESTALDTADIEPWEQYPPSGVKTRSASASAGAGRSFDLPSSRWPVGSAGTEYRRKGHSWRGRQQRLDSGEGVVSSDDSFLSTTQVSPDVHVHHRSRSAAPARSGGEGSYEYPELRADRPLVHSPPLVRVPSLEQPSSAATFTSIKSAPMLTTSSPPPLSRSRTPDPDHTYGVRLSRIVTAPPQDSSLADFAAPSPLVDVDVVVRRDNGRSRANKLAKMGFTTPETKILSTGAATPPGHGLGHKFGLRSLVQTLKGKS